MTVIAQDAHITAGAWAACDMAGFQTKAPLVTPISGDNFGFIPPNCMVGQACVLRYS